MYLIIAIFLALCALLFILNCYRSKSIVRKICCMSCCEKKELLDQLTKPFGFCYLPDQDLISSTLDAWQKDFGYCSLYDKTAPHFHMIFDCEPVYFDYDGRTWLIEFWKGQYGISLGAEIGIYQADTLLHPAQYTGTSFHALPEDQLFPIFMGVNFRRQSLFSLQQSHWWLTGFRVGSYCEPEDITLDISLTFPTEPMLYSFVESLLRLGYEEHNLCICCLTVSFTFVTPHSSQPRHSCSPLSRITQWKNRILCRLYQFITRPFICTSDRILFLYFFLPAAFRHILCLRKNRRQKLPHRIKRSRSPKRSKGGTDK